MHEALDASPHGRITSVFFDIDGTLNDSNDSHARSWCDTFAEAGIPIAYERIRPLIGMGSDKLLETLQIQFATGSDDAQKLVARRKAIFLERYLGEVRPFPQAGDLVRALKQTGLRCIVASSASPEELGPLLALAGVSDLFDHAVKPDEVERTKPDPDIVLAALKASRSQAASAIFIGDTRYDIEAAHDSGVRCIAFRCGGSSDSELSDADAIFDSPAALLAALADSDLEAVISRSPIQQSSV